MSKFCYEPGELQVLDSLCQACGSYDESTNLCEIHGEIPESVWHCGVNEKCPDYTNGVDKIFAELAKKDSEEKGDNNGS